MKRFLFGWLFLAVIVCSAVNAQAYFVDSPHNESNGIYCYMCHNNSAWYWGDPNNGTGNIDVTIRNTVCLSCHDDPANLDLANPWVKQAPIKSLHSSTTTSNAKGSWSTQCTDCHDPHTQPQLQWANSDSGAFWLADGLFDYTFGENPTFNAGDPDGLGYGATTIGISFVGGQAGWTDPLTWGYKGGKIDASRAVDNSRGLIMVPNKGTPTDNFEILNAVDLGGGNYRLKVKGQMTSAQEFVTFGVFYGQSLKSSVTNPVTLLTSPVKYFQPAIVDGTYGGWIDDTPATSAPLGLCQVCHTLTSYWNSDGSNPTHNDVTNCSDCHDILIGGSGGADHTAKIANYFNDAIYTPAVDCSVCHDPSEPTILHNNAINTVTSGVGCEACHNVGQTQLDADVASRLGVTPQFGDDGAWPYDCSGCHPGKPAAVDGGTHGGHGPGHFGWNEGADNCDDCHSATPGAPTEEVVLDVHGNTCTICHDPAQLALNNYTVRIDGNAANGVDGSAIGFTTFSVCTDCHNPAIAAVNSATMGGIHHDSKSGYAAADNCTFCHTGAYSGDHTTSVTAVALCSNCHAATGNTVDPGDPTIHNACVSCHETDGSLINPASSPLVTDVPAGGAATNDGGGNCSTCHAAYFNDHDHGHGLLTEALCLNCHTATAAPFSATGEVHEINGCATCHDLDATPTGATIGSAVGKLGNENCSACHTGYFDNHTHGHTMNFVALCAGCHSPSVAPFTADALVHATSGCFTCHNATTGALMGSAVGATGGEDCQVCHATYFDGHAHAHTFTTNGAASPTTAVCDGCHTVATGTPFTSGADVHSGSGCATCHNLPTNGNLIGSAIGQAGATECISCHAVYFDGHTVHSATGGHDVTYTPAVDTSQTGSQGCGDGGCHLPLNTNWTGIIDEHNVATNGAGACATCHNSGRTTAVSVGFTSVNHVIMTGSGITCDTCHEDKTPDVGHGGHDASHFSGDAVCTTCHIIPASGVVEGIHSNSCTLCHDNAGGGTGTAIVGVNGDGDANLGESAAPHSAVSCLTCHPSATYPASAIHHDTTSVASGTCTTCHTDPRSVPTGMAHAPYQMACRACHIDIAGDTVTVMGITPGVAGSTADGLQSGNVRAAVPDHSWTITAASSDGSGGLDKIQNYGACLYCHGSTGWAASRAGATVKPIPYHAQKTWAEMGGIGMFSGDESLFRAGAGYGATSPIGEQAFFAHGRGRFNMKRAEFSIKDHYLQPGDFGENLAAHTGDYQTTAAVIPDMYTFFEMYSANLGANAVIPAFDQDYIGSTQCSGSCDTVTIDTNTCSKGGSCLDTRVLTIIASSSDNTAQLTVIHAGVATPMSCSSGNCSLTIDYTGYPAESQFDPTDAKLDSVWVISDKGGSVRWESLNDR